MKHELGDLGNCVKRKPLIDTTTITGTIDRFVVYTAA